MTGDPCGGNVRGGAGCKCAPPFGSDARCASVSAAVSAEKGAAGIPTAEIGAADVDLALGMFAALGLRATSDDLSMITIPGPPWSKSRPRFARNGHVYSKPEDQDAEQRTAMHLRRVVKSPYTGNVGIGCIFFRPNRQRIDADNLLKHVCDAANGVLWADDSQCTVIMGRIELDAARPRTVVVVGEHFSTMTRGTNAVYPCAVCGSPISMVGQDGRRRKTCSKRCTAAIRGHIVLADHPIPCAYCREPFIRTTVAQTMCSPGCRGKNLRGRRKAAAAPFSTCGECGVQLTHRRGGRCRDCWRKNPAGAAS